MRATGSQSRCQQCYGRLTLTSQFVFDDSQVLEAARKANAHDFIMEFPQGYDNQALWRAVPHDSQHM